METLAIITLCVMTLDLFVFILGPAVLEKFFQKVDEWEEITASEQDEK